MITTLKSCAAVLLLALTGFFAYRAGADHATSQDEAIRLKEEAAMQASAERQQKLDEAEQMLLTTRLSDTEAAYADLEKSVPETELLRAPTAANCGSDALFDAEFVRLWNSGASGTSGAEQTHRGDAALRSATQASRRGGDRAAGTGGPGYPADGEGDAKMGRALQR